MNATTLIAVALCFLLVLWPERTLGYLLLFSFKVQVWFLNLRMKFAAWRIYRSLARDMEKRFGSEMPPFKWVDLWERD